MEHRTHDRPDQPEGRDDRILLSRLVADRGPIDVTRTIAYVLHALEEVCDAHEKQLVHCHLRPENLILGSGRVTVLGFENAKTKTDGSIPDAPASTGAGILDTEPHYMSPEQIGAPATVDARSDVWSLGATAFFLLTGRPPFVGENDYVVTTQILVDDAPRVASLRPAVAPRLDQIIARCLTRNREERFQTALQLREALVSLQRDMARRFDATLRSPEEMAEARAGFPRPPEVVIVEPATKKFDATARIDELARAPRPASSTGETKRIARPDLPDDGPTDVGALREALPSKGGTLVMPPMAARAVPASGGHAPYTPSGAPPAMSSGGAVPPAMSSGMLPPSGASGAWPSLAPPAAPSARAVGAPAPQAPPRGGLVAFVVVTLAAIAVLALGLLRYFHKI